MVDANPLFRLRSITGRSYAAPGVLLVSVSIGGWGAWSVLAGLQVAIQGPSSEEWRFLALVLFLFGIFCFGSVFGLITFKPWAPRTLIVLNAVMVSANLATGYILREYFSESSFAYLLLSVVFAIWTARYFTRPSIVALYNSTWKREGE